MATAKREDVEALHDLLTQHWATRLKAAKQEGGEPLTAAELTALAKFLKDNNVTALLTGSPAGKSVLEDLPFEVEVEGETAE